MWECFASGLFWTNFVAQFCIFCPFGWECQIRADLVGSLIKAKNKILAVVMNKFTAKQTNNSCGKKEACKAWASDFLRIASNLVSLLFTQRNVILIRKQLLFSWIWARIQGMIKFSKIILREQYSKIVSKFLSWLPGPKDVMVPFEMVEITTYSQGVSLFPPGRRS